MNPRVWYDFLFFQNCCFQISVCRVDQHLTHLPPHLPCVWACVRADGRVEETDTLARRTGRLVIKSRINEGLQPGSFENTCVSSGSDVSYYGERKHFESLGPAGATTGGDCPIEGPTVKARMGGSSLRASGFCHANHLYDRVTLRRQHSCGPSSVALKLTGVAGVLTGLAVSVL